MLARSRDSSPSPYLKVLPTRPPEGATLGFVYDPTPDQLRRALEGNQRQWLLRLARYGGELVERDGGLLWHDAPGETAGEIQIPFPRFDRGRLTGQLDGLVARVRARQPLRPVRLWVSEPARPEELPILLT